MPCRACISEASVLLLEYAPHDEHLAPQDHDRCGFQMSYGVPGQIMEHHACTLPAGHEGAHTCGCHQWAEDFTGASCA